MGRNWQRARLNWLARLVDDACDRFDRGATRLTTTDNLAWIWPFAVLLSPAMILVLIGLIPVALVCWLLGWEE